MNSHVNVRLTGRPMAAAVLAAFLLLPPTGAWIRMRLESASHRAHESVRADTKSSPRPGKNGWPRKALIPKATAEVKTAAGAKRMEDRQNHWAFIAAPPPSSGTRLTLCAEFTKPASLGIESMGSVRHRRPPPAPAL